MQCEVCEERGYEVDGIIDGEYKRICRHCAQMEGATVIERPTNVNIAESFKRASSRDVLMRMSGMNARKRLAGLAARKEVHLDDLRPVKRAIESDRQDFDNQMAKINTIQQPQEAPKKSSWFSWFGGRSNASEEKAVQPQFPEPKKEPVNMKRELNANEVLDL